MIPNQTSETDWPTLAAAVMDSRQTVLPKRLVDPGPNAAQRQGILQAAASAPDHGRIVPWRFVEVAQAHRGELAQAFASALAERDSQAAPEQLAQAREKAYRAPWLMLVVVDEQCGDPEIDLLERIVSAGCAIQNILLMATAYGYGSALTSGKALKSGALRQLFGLQPGEHALCFISIGTAAKQPSPRPRPDVHAYSQTLNPHIHES